jgi:hypothetical protein
LKGKNSTVHRVNEERIAALVGRNYQKPAPCQDFGVTVVVSRVPEPPRAFEVAPARMRVPLKGRGWHALFEVILQFRAELNASQKLLSVLVPNTAKSRRLVVEIRAGDPLYVLLQIGI